MLRAKANPDHQDKGEATALMLAARAGHEACVQALLRAKANAELQDDNGATALHWAEAEGQTATAALLRQHASCLSRGFGLSLCAALPLNPKITCLILENLGNFAQVCLRCTAFLTPR